MFAGQRTPFFIVAIILAVFVLFVDLGAPIWLGGGLVEGAGIGGLIDEQLREHDVDDPEEVKADANKLAEGEEPPGFGIPSLALIDGLLLYLLIVQAVSQITSKLTLRADARSRAVIPLVQGIVTLLVSLGILIGSIVLIFAVLALLLLMVGLFLSAPFGTIAYFCIYGFFDRGGATATLTASMILRIAFVIFLVLAHQRNLRIPTLVLLILTGFLGVILLSFLHGFVPIFLVSITDALGAIIVGILALIWAIILLIGAIIAVVKGIIAVVAG